MTFETTDPEGAKERLDGDQEWTFLDVRTVQEFEAGHVPGAYNVPLLELTPESRVSPNAAIARLSARRPPLATATFAAVYCEERPRRYRRL